MSLTVNPGLLEQAAPDVQVVGVEAYGQRIEGASAGGRVEQGSVRERIPVEQVCERPDHVREVDEPVVICPLAVIVVRVRAEQEIRWLPSRNRGERLGLNIIEGWLFELDLFSGLLLEGGDDFPDRLVLLRVEPLLPPHHEVGGVCAERRYCERRGKKNGLLAHGRLLKLPPAHLSLASLRRSSVEYKRSARRSWLGSSTCQTATGLHRWGVRGRA
jgi:hypothetical protein